MNHQSNKNLFKLIRTLSFIIGDGSIDKKQIRFSNSDKLVAKTILKDFRDFFRIKKSPSITLTVPRDFDEQKTSNKLDAWEDYLKYKISKVRKKHISYINGKEFISKKEYVEVSFISSKLYGVVSNYLSKIKEWALTDKKLTVAYLQGIYSAEGCISYSKFNRLRTIQIKMKDKEEIFFITKLLNFLGINNSGMKSFKDGSYFIYITNRENIKKCYEIDIFRINQKRKDKLKEVLNNYQRIQVASHFKEDRYSQIISLLGNEKNINSHNLSRQLNMSLCRTQVLLQNGFNERKWDRLWNGEEFLYMSKNG